MANNKIQVKRTSTSGRTPNTTNSGNAQYIAAGELALNMADGILYTSNGSVLIPVGANNSSVNVSTTLSVNGVTTINASGVTSTSNVSGSILVSTQSSGAEGGEIQLAKAQTSTLTGNIFVDIYDNRIRFFEQGTSTRGAYIDLTACANGVGTNLLTGGGGVDVTAQFTWTNTHTFQANVAFTGNNITVVSNTGSVMFGGAGDTNWRIGRSTGSTTKFYYTNNTLDILAADSNLEGVVIGKPGGNTYIETGYAGTFTKNPIYVGNATVNVTINSTSFSGTANNAVYLGGIGGGSYLRSDVSDQFSGAILQVYNDTGVLGSTTGEANTLQIYQANVNADAFLTFHVSGDTAFHFGLDGTTNDLFVGGWSLGANKYKVWHQNNDGAGSGLDADTLDGSHASAFQTTAGLSANVATLTANNTTYVNGKTEGNLNVNNALTANNSSYLGGTAAASFVQNTDSRTLSGNLTFTANVTLNGLIANGGIGTAGHVLHSDGSKVYWAADDQGVTSVATGNGMTGGTITATGTVSVLANTGIIANATGVYVNATYIGTLSANNSSYLGGTAAASYVQNTDSRTLSGNLNISGTYFNPTSNTVLLGNSTQRWVLSTNTIDATGNFTTSANVTANNANTTYDLNVGRNLVVTGNLTVTGNVTVIGANNLSIVDNMIYLNSNSTTANPDLGIAGNYNDGTYRHTGFFRDASDGFWKVFDSYLPEPDANVFIDTTNASFSVANFWANTVRVGNTSVYSTINTTSFSGTANNASYLGGIVDTSYLRSDASDVFSGSYFNPSSNTILLGNSTQRWVLSANTGNFSGAVSGITTLAAGNTTITGFSNVSSDGQFSGNVGIGIAPSSAVGLYVSKTWSSDAGLYGLLNTITDANTSMTSARNKIGNYTQLINQNQNKSSDGLTTYNSNYFASYNYVYNGSPSTGGDAYAAALFSSINRSYQYANGVNANTVTDARGTISEVFQFGSGVISTAYGTVSQVIAGNSSVTGNITTAFGSYSGIVSNTAMTIGTGYLYYGTHLGATTTTKWGMYLTGEDKNYFSGNVGIGTTSPNAKLQVAGTANISGAVAISGSLTTQGQVANATGFYPTSNTVGDLLGNTTARWDVFGINADFSGNVTVNGLIANGSLGSAKQVLYTDGTKAYWSPTLLVYNAAGTQVFP